MTKSVLKAALVIFLLISPLFAEQEPANQKGKKEVPQIQHEITVTSTRIDTPTREVASSVTVISRENIERSRKTTVLEILQDVMGITLIQNGPVGAAASVHIRGGNAEHTLVMMDGVELNDPITPSRSIDLAHYSLDNVERIEVLRGPQSTLYGSDAISGVINIITRKGEGRPTLSFSSQAGSYGTFSGSTTFSGSSERISYSLGASLLQSAGFSAANQSYEGNSEKDGYQNLTFSGHFGFRLSDNFEFDFVARRIDTKIDIDNFGGAYGDDTNNIQTYNSLFMKGQTRWLLWNNRWEQKLNLSIVDYDRTYENPTDEAHPFDSEQAYYSSRCTKIDWQNNLYFHETNTMTFGIDFQEEHGESEYTSEGQWGPYQSLFPHQKARTTGLYVQDQLRLGGQFYATLGGRLDIHSQFGSSLTFRLAPAYLIQSTGTKIKGTIGTGFKSPSLYQLYAPGTLWGPVGNDTLTSEKSTGWDIGVEQSFLSKRITLRAQYFSQTYNNLIDFDYLEGYINISKAESRGFEFGFMGQITENLSFYSSYTTSHHRDTDTGEPLIRRPTSHFQSRININFLTKGNLEFSLQSVGKRDDIEFVGFSSNRVTMPAYTLFNSTISYDVLPLTQIFIRLENIFNADYETVKGYGAPGFSIYGGFKVDF
ncbi:MAG: TonB-dependent receptor [Candidatus Aminicenantes bacterium]|nr:TonB-dependent receptor [Candidatus Aminicenantes bacterium]